jgi:hypothetical protein
LLDDVDALMGFQIERKGLLVSRLQVPPQRRAFVHLSPFAQGVTMTHRFDLDHLRTKLTEQACCKRRGD